MIICAQCTLLLVRQAIRLPVKQCPSIGEDYLISNPTEYTCS